MDEVRLTLTEVSKRVDESLAQSLAELTPLIVVMAEEALDFARIEPNEDGSPVPVSLSRLQMVLSEGIGTCAAMLSTLLIKRAFHDR